MSKNREVALIQRYYTIIVVVALIVLCLLITLVIYSSVAGEKSDTNTSYVSEEPVLQYDNDWEPENVAENEVANLDEINDDLSDAVHEPSGLNQKISELLLLDGDWEFGESKGWHGAGIYTWWRLNSLEPILTMNGPQFTHSFGFDDDLAYWTIEVDEDNADFYYDQAENVLLSLGFVEDQTRQLSNGYGSRGEEDRLALYILDDKVYSLTYYYSAMQIFDANLVALRELGTIDEWEKVEEEQRNSLIAAAQKTNGEVDKFFEREEYQGSISYVHTLGIRDITTDEDRARNIERFDVTINPFSDICMGNCYIVSFTVNKQTDEVKTVLKIFNQPLLDGAEDYKCAQTIDDEVADPFDKKILVDYYCNVS